MYLRAATILSVCKLLRQKSCNNHDHSLVQNYSQLPQVLTGTVPYSALNKLELLETVVFPGLAPAIEESLPVNIKNLLKDCFSLDPQKRPDMAAI